MLIKRHISKRQLKRPEGKEAIRAHLYVDERESIDRPCIRIQKGRSLASTAKYAVGERAREAVIKWERGGSGKGMEGKGGRKNGSFHHSSSFLFYIVPKKNKRTNTFLNKGKSLEVEARWGREGLRCGLQPSEATIHLLSHLLSHSPHTSLKRTNPAREL